MSILLGRKAILLFTLLTCTILSKAQHTDAGVWSKFGIKKKFEGPWSIQLGSQLRTAQFSSVLNDIMLDVEGGYKLSDHISTSLTFRQGWRRELDGTLLPRQRISLDLQGKGNVGKTGISFRTRYQLGFRFAQTEATGPLNDALRFRVKLDQKLIKKTELNAAIECFTEANYGQYLLTAIRYQIEVTRKLKKRHYLSVGYQFQKEQQTTDPLSEHIVLLSFNLELK